MTLLSVFLRPDGPGPPSLACRLAATMARKVPFHSLSKSTLPSTGVRGTLATEEELGTDSTIRRSGLWCLFELLMACDGRCWREIPSRSWRRTTVKLGQLCTDGTLDSFWTMFEGNSVYTLTWVDGK